MNGETLLEALTDVDPALVQAAGKARRRPAWRMWAAAAACVCLLLGLQRRGRYAGKRRILL